MLAEHAAALRRVDEDHQRLEIAREPEWLGDVEPPPEVADGDLRLALLLRGGDRAVEVILPFQPEHEGRFVLDAELERGCNCAHDLAVFAGHLDPAVRMSYGTKGLLEYRPQVGWAVLHADSRVARVLVVEQLLDQPIECVAERRANRDLADQTRPQRLDALSIA